MPRLSKTKVRQIFRELSNDMRVETSSDGVKDLVYHGQSIVDQASGSARHHAEKLQKKLARLGEEKQRQIMTGKKSFSISGKLAGTGITISKSEERLKPRRSQAKGKRARFV